MAKPSKRVQKKSTGWQFSIEQLLLALNTKIPSTQSGAAIEALRRAVPDAGTLARIVLKLQQLVVDPPKVVDVRDHLWNPAARHLFQLNQELARYTSFPYISTDVEGGWSFGWHVQTTAYGKDESLVLISRAQNEFPHVLTAIGLAREGLIDRVRRCKIDRRWFYARTKESRFCSSKCRNMFHQLDPRDKERRRKWARENYQTRKTPEAGSTKAANQRTIRNSGRKSK
jgi:hypothetical protein